MSEIRNYIRNTRREEVNKELDNLIASLKAQGLSVEFGNIGAKTTYALLYNEDHSTEYVGYTFIKNIKYYSEDVGKLKALYQAIARKETLSSEE